MYACRDGARLNEHKTQPYDTTALIATKKEQPSRVCFTPPPHHSIVCGFTPTAMHGISKSSYHPSQPIAWKFAVRQTHQQLTERPVS